MKKFDHESGQFFEIEGANIYYEEIKNPEKPYLLLLHGGFGHLEYFNPITPYLADKFSLIAIDGRGQGKSTLGTAKLTYAQMQRDAEALIQSLGIEKVSILGFSDGGIVGYRMAASGTTPIDKLITIGGTWSEADVLASKERFEKVSPESWRERLPDSYNDYQRLNPAIDFSVTAKAIREMWLDTSPATGYPGEMVKQIRCPTLIIRGDKDDFFPRKSAAELADHIADSAFFNVPFASHVAIEDQPELVKTALDLFWAA
ncbi:alpha/beta hydrolase [Spirosoma sp. BT702]|uniref:Alpha/beta hydrolase n=1 Tax=Spirosoma profusum TaxID=2771354 RepID=A0A926XV85_9BACT|nr:alpha/beta hydrolase [Spirosoma profusum]MBD2701224.1 alpha/beta hydrolase [Spirosoma profusum]